MQLDEVRLTFVFSCLSILGKLVLIVALAAGLLTHFFSMLYVCYTQFLKSECDPWHNPWSPFALSCWSYWYACVSKFFIKHCIYRQQQQIAGNVNVVCCGQRTSLRWAAARASSLCHTMKKSTPGGSASTSRNPSVLQWLGEWWAQVILSGSLVLSYLVCFFVSSFDFGIVCRVQRVVENWKSDEIWSNNFKAMKTYWKFIVYQKLWISETELLKTFQWKSDKRSTSQNITSWVSIIMNSHKALLSHGKENLVIDLKKLWNFVN